MANSSISISSIVINSVISASVAVSTVSASPSYPDITVGVSISNQSINASYFIVPTSILPEQQVEATDVGDGVGVETDLQTISTGANSSDGICAAIDDIVSFEDRSGLVKRSKIYGEKVKF